MNDTTQSILIIEDEAPLAGIISKKFDKKGIHTHLAKTTDEALDILRSDNSVSAIWLDHYLLGSKSGLDLIVELKSGHSHWRDIPVYVVSNTATDTKQKEYLELGAEKFYTKSNYQLKEIVDEVSKNVH